MSLDIFKIFFMHCPPVTLGKMNTVRGNNAYQAFSTALPAARKLLLFTLAFFFFL